MKGFQPERYPVLSLSIVTLIGCYIAFLFAVRLQLQHQPFVDQPVLFEPLEYSNLSYLLAGYPVAEQAGEMHIQQPSSQNWYSLAACIQGAMVQFSVSVLSLLITVFIALYLIRAYAVRCQRDVLAPILGATQFVDVTARSPSIENSVRTPHQMQAEILGAIDKIRTKGIVLEAEAYTDKLTGLNDRHAFLDRLDNALNSSKQNNQMLAVLFIDLDGFKQVNDSFGHSIGDEVLVTVSQRLKNQADTMPEPLHVSADNLSRLGGDEFALMIVGGNARTDSIAVAGLLLDAIEKDIVIGNKTVNISASIGIANYPDSVSRPEMLLQMADVAMYRAKTDGKGVYRIYSPEMGNKGRRYHYLLEEMEATVRDTSFSLNFQPIIQVNSCQVSCFEALLRWDHPEEGHIAPSEFIPIAEESSLILKIGDWVLDEACSQMQRWYNAGMSKVRVSVNVSSTQIRHRNLHEWVMAALQKCNLPPTALTLEITESCLLDANADVLDQINSLREVGVYIAIDDFGTGCSSLSMLTLLPIDVLKIDRSFISQARDSNKHKKILLSIAELAKKLNLSVVAEGIEYTEELVMMQEMGIDCIQGFLISRPQSICNVDRRMFHESMGQMAINGTRIWTPGL